MKAQRGRSWLQCTKTLLNINLTISILVSLIN